MSGDRLPVGEYLVDGYVDPAYVEGAVLVSNFTKYADDGYVVNDYYENDGLSVSVHLQAQGGLLHQGQTASASAVRVTASAGLIYQASTAANVELVISSTASNLIGAQITTAPNAVQLTAAAALTQSTDTTMPVSVSTEIFGMVLEGIPVYVDEAYRPYTWDSTGSWDDWPNNIWGAEGVTVHIQSSLQAQAGMLLSAAAAFTVHTSVESQGNHRFAGLAALDSEFSQITAGNHRFAGVATLDSEFAQSTQGNYIWYSSAALQVRAGLADALGSLIKYASADIESAADLAVAQSGLIYAAESIVSTAADLAIDQSGRLGTAGIVFHAVPERIDAWYSTITAGVFIYRDPYRSIIVPRETRVLRIPARPELITSAVTRIIKTQEESRTFRVGRESRILTEGIAVYDTSRRRKI